MALQHFLPHLVAYYPQSCHWHAQKSISASLLKIPLAHFRLWDFSGETGRNPSVMTVSIETWQHRPTYEDRHQGATHQLARRRITGTGLIRKSRDFAASTIYRGETARGSLAGYRRQTATY